MAGAKFEYDESGSTFFYFLLSFEALVVIPCTYYFYPRSQQPEKRDKTICHCEPCCIKNTRLQQKEPWRKAKERFIKLLLLIGWLILFMTAYKVRHLQHDVVIYDPFEILEIETDASMGEIKKAYRRLSLRYHPDKEGGDELKFMRIAKAYAALTDDEARKNWEVYGNPDGPGPTSFGIALPSWIVEKENSVWVLGLYALVFMVALPVSVWYWWHLSIQYSGEDVLIETTQLYYYFIYKTPSMILKRMLMVLAASLEFEKSHNSNIVERASDNVEVPQIIKELGNVGEKNREKPLCFSYALKARSLLHAHLTRLKLPNTLESDKLVILKSCPKLIQEFVSCIAQLTMLALAGRISRMPTLNTMENAMKLSCCLIQGLWDNKSPLLQLPHITEDILRHFTTRKRNIRSITDFAQMFDSDRRNMLRTLNDDEYQDLMNAISKMPVIQLEVRSEVLDDEDSCYITTGAIVTVTVNLIRKNMSEIMKKTESVSKEKETAEDDNLEHENIPNGDISPKAKKTKVWEKSKKKKSKGGGKKPKKKPPVQSKSDTSTKKETVNVESLPNGVPKQEEKKEKSTHSHKENDDKEEREKESSSSDVDDSDANEPSSSKGKNDVEEDDEEWEKFRMVKKKDKALETKSKKSHIVHCPYFPDEKHEHWWVYLSDKNKQCLITNPYFVTNLVTREEVELKFAAPLKPGIYCYQINVRCDSYIDFDVTRMIQFDVKEAKEIDITKVVQWDVSEEEEEKDDEESAVEDSDLASDEEVDE